VRILRAARGFGAFAWDFLVGDDWLVAAIVVLAMAATAVVARQTAGWWLVPAVLLVVLPYSLWRAVRR
jgi:hypothetical protein